MVETGLHGLLKKLIGESIFSTLNFLVIFLELLPDKESVDKKNYLAGFSLPVFSYAVYVALGTSTPIKVTADWLFIRLFLAGEDGHVGFGCLSLLINGDDLGNPPTVQPMDLCDVPGNLGRRGINVVVELGMGKSEVAVVVMIQATLHATPVMFHATKWVELMVFLLS